MCNKKMYELGSHPSAIRDLFEFYPINFGYFMITIGLSLVMVVIMEIVKLVNRIKTKKE